MSQTQEYSYLLLSIGTGKEHQVQMPCWTRKAVTTAFPASRVEIIGLNAEAFFWYCLVPCCGHQVLKQHRKKIGQMWALIRTSQLKTIDRWHAGFFITSWLLHGWHSRSGTLMIQNKLPTWKSLSPEIQKNPRNSCTLGLQYLKLHKYAESVVIQTLV